MIMQISSVEIHQKISELTSPGAYFEPRYTLIEERGYKTYKNAPKTLVDVIQAGREYGEEEFLVYQKQPPSLKQVHLTRVLSCIPPVVLAPRRESCTDTSPCARP